MKKAAKKISPESKGYKPNDVKNKGRGAYAKSGKGKKSVNK
jgi:hypothetical protein